MAKVNYSPKQVARAIGVSESSCKRWCDLGVIPTVKTPGGHRRVTLDGILEFARSTQRDVVNPELLGLPANCGKSERSTTRVRDQLFECLLKGDEHVCRQLLFDQWIEGVDMATIGDQLIGPVFVMIGEKWACREAEVYQEPRACEVMLRVLHELHNHIQSS
ncbi:MAG: B12-binding domain-containing protein, partial [Planctomycetes bacterium]|nr:B12-binding domain-containing protein [Planctomycetota bacterium]